jgi:hypothetical protein
MQSQKDTKKTKDELIIDTLKPDFDLFTNSCIKIYREHKETLDEHYKKTHEDLIQKFGGVMRGSIAKILDSKEFYDHTDILEVKDLTCCSGQDGHKFPIFINSPSACRSKPYDINQFLTQCLTCINSEDDKKLFADCKKKFLDMHTNEKIIVVHSVQLANRDFEMIIMTNFSKIYKIKHSEYSIVSWSYVSLDYWIPRDYLEIIKLSLQMTDNSSKTLKPVVDILKYIKDTLYNRKYTPLYVKDIIEENTKLTEKFVQYDKDAKAFYAAKTKFETEMKPYMDLAEERKALDKIKEEIKKEKEKLRLVATKLEMDKNRLTEEMKLLKDMNINEILKE